MPHDDTPSRTAAATEARLNYLASVAAQDPQKLQRALRVIKAALEQQLITLDELTEDAA